MPYLIFKKKMVEKMTKWEFYEKSSFWERLRTINFLVDSISRLRERLTENEEWSKDDYKSIAGLLWERQKELKSFREISGLFSMENILGSLGIFWSLIFIYLLYQFFNYFYGFGIGLMS
jgi:hypothetical protein